MQSLVTNPKALKALQKIQQGVDMLHSEAPSLVSRLPLHELLQFPEITSNDIPETVQLHSDRPEWIPLTRITRLNGYHLSCPV